VLSWRESREVERLDELAAGIDLQAALAVATADQFGAAGPAVHGGWGPAPDRPDAPATPPGHHPARDRAAAPRPQSAPFGLVLLISVFLGGLIATLPSGRFALRTDMGDGYRRIVTGNPVWMVVLLFVGGALVGFGTRMAGGCTSGHGLTGCSRLRPTSLIATAVFFGAAVATSFLLRKVI
jgi:hypothetical protein